MHTHYSLLVFYDRPSLVVSNECGAVVLVYHCSEVLYISQVYTALHEFEID